MTSRNERVIFVRRTQALSAPSFQKIWDNEEDAVYDNLQDGLRV